MVDVEQFKKQLHEEMTQDFKMEFLGKDFDTIVKLLSEERSGKIVEWVRNVVARTVQPIVVNAGGQYKGWSGNELLVFRKELDVDGGAYRVLLVKVKNAVYIEFHLGDHKYYDKVRKDLGLKKTSY